MDEGHRLPSSYGISGKSVAVLFGPDLGERTTGAGGVGVLGTWDTSPDTREGTEPKRSTRNTEREGKERGVTTVSRFRGRVSVRPLG